MKETIKQYLKKIDITLIVTMSILIGIGIYCVQQAYMFNDTLELEIRKKVIGVGIGVVVSIFILFIDYRVISNLSPILYIAINLLLTYTLFFGDTVNYVTRWVTIFGIQIQPSELTKVVLIIFITFLCNYFKSKMDKFYVLVILGIAVIIPTVLILKEPHLSSTLAILFIFCVMVFISEISFKVLGKAIAIMIPIIAALLIAVAVFDVDIPFIEKYQVNRILSHFSDDESESLSGAYQQLQSISAISSGGLQGKMVNESASTRRNYSTIYAKESDFVFAIVGEEFGFIGSVLVVILFAILVVRCFIIGVRAGDYVGRMLCIGVSSYLFFQSFVNIGVAINLLPNTGLTLPFISNGLTSLISCMAAVGLVLNVGMRQRTTLINS